MKQIIVNVDGLPIEEKQRVSEALAKIKNIGMCNPMHWDKVEVMYGPSFDGVNVGFDYHKDSNPTHTPQQVLEMDTDNEQDVILADTLIITDSSGNLIYDSTIHALNRLISQRANSGKGWALPDSGVSVKLDKNGLAGMVEKRKVRKDFDAGKEYSVNVEGCTEEEKKEVQQAFFDVGFPWKLGGKEYRCLDAVQYSNVLIGRGVTANLMYGYSTERCNMTAKEFLELVYEQGHVHSESMTLYAEDAKTHSKPWELWQNKAKDGFWWDCLHSPLWASTTEYRRKPTTHIVHGVEIPDLRVTPELGEQYYLADPTASELTELHTFVMRAEKLWAERGLCYEPTEEGKQAAILHTKAMMGMVQ